MLVLLFLSINTLAAALVGVFWQFIDFVGHVFVEYMDFRMQCSLPDSFLKYKKESHHLLFTSTHTNILVQSRAPHDMNFVAQQLPLLNSQHS